jgi:hypothetical protein
MDSHCATGGLCNKDAPGGICDGCGASTTNCPATFDDTCFMNVCLRDCSSAAECLTGQSCAGIGGNMHCALKTCSGPADCPSIYECRPLGGGGGTSYCQRVRCPADAGVSCPSGTICENGVCRELHLTF